MGASSAIVFGSEHSGLPDFFLSGGHSGLPDSLNVNDAAAIVLYDAVRQRLSQKG